MRRLDPAIFTDEMVAGLRMALPEREVLRKGVLWIGLDGVRDIRLDNLFLACEGGQAEPEGALRFLLERLREPSKEPDPGEIVPLIRTQGWVAGAGVGLPQREFVGGLRWVCAFDRGGSLSLVRRIDADKLRMRDERLFSVAERNLTERARDLRLSEIGGGVYRLELDHVIDSSLLLLGGWMAEQAGRWAGRLFACAPAGGLLLLSDRPEEIEKIGKELFFQEHHRLSPRLLRWTGTAWETEGKAPEGPWND